MHSNILIHIQSTLSIYLNSNLMREYFIICYSHSDISFDAKEKYNLFLEIKTL